MMGSVVSLPWAPRWTMAGGESSRTPRRAPARRREARVDQSRSAFRLITAHAGARHPHAVALDAAVELAAILVLLEEGLEGVEERHAGQRSRIDIVCAGQFQYSTNVS